MKPSEPSGPIQPGPDDAEGPSELTKHVIGMDTYILPAPLGNVKLKGPWPGGRKTMNRDKGETAQAFWEKCEKALRKRTVALYTYAHA